MRFLQKLFQLLLIAVAILGVMVLGYIATVALFDQPQYFLVILLPTFLGGVTLAGVWTILATAARRRRASMLLSYIEQAVRLNLPLPRVVQAMAQSATGGFARDLEEARIRLEQGESLATVLEVIPKIPPRVIGLVAAAERSGRLPQVLSQLMEQRRQAIAWRFGQLSFYRIYPLIVGLVLVTVASILMVFVIPKFEMIFRDFHTELPAVTQLVIYTFRSVWPWLPMLLVVIFLALLFNAMVTRWQGAGYGIVPGFAARVADRLPGIGKVRMTRALGEALTYTADAVEAGRPLDASLLESAQLSSNVRLRRQVEVWVDRQSRGEPPAQAARAAGLPRLIWGMLATAVQTPDLAPVLRFLGRYYSTRFSRSIALLEAAITPAVAVLLGFFVAILALSVFAPLITLIQSLSGPASSKL